MAIKHVWEKWNISTSYSKETGSIYSPTNLYAYNGDSYIPSSSNLYYAAYGQASISGDTFTLRSFNSKESISANGSGSIGVGNYMLVFAPSAFSGSTTLSKVKHYYSYRDSNSTYDGTGTYWKGDELIHNHLVATTIQGTTSYGYVSSDSASAYPTNGVSGSYWYKYVGTESVNYVGHEGTVKEVKAVACVNGVVKTNVSTYQGVSGVVKQS